MVKQAQPCPNESGECWVEGCDNTESSIWYGKKVNEKYCKHCYDTKFSPKKRKGSPTAEMQQQAPEQASSGGGEASPGLDPMGDRSTSTPRAHRVALLSPVQ